MEKVEDKAEPDASRLHTDLRSEENRVEGFDGSQLRSGLSSQTSVSSTSQDDLSHLVSAFDTLVVAKRHHNSETHVAKLPADILLSIFELHAKLQPPAGATVKLDDGSATLPSDQSALSRLGWIVDTHVCHQWRHIAISAAALWTTIPFKLGQRWVDTSISRAQSAGLTMQYNFPLDGTVSPLTTRLFSDTLHQVVSLHLAHNAQELQKVVKTLVRPAPLLEKVVFGLHAKEKTYRNFPVVLPIDLFGGHAPQLRQLLLDRTYLPWTSTLFRNLSVLIIQQTPHPSSRTQDIVDGDVIRPYVPDSDLVPSCSQFLDVLRSCQGLRTLVLVGCLPSTYNVRADTPPVPLCHLEVLGLLGGLAGIECVFRHCVLPERPCAYSIHVSLSSSDLPRLPHVLHPLLPAARSHPLRTLRISPLPAMADAGIQITAWHAVLATAWGDIDFTHGGDFHLGIHVRDRQWLQGEEHAELDRVYDLLAPENIETLLLIPGLGAVGEHMPFVARTKLKNLYVHRALPLPVLFIGTESPPGTGAPSSLTCPTLQTIWFVGVDFGTHSCTDTTDPFASLINPELRITWEEWLHRWLTRRSEAGIRLETLVFDQCVVSSTCLDKIRPVVSTVAIRAADHGDPEPY
ncbi:hypothetical protein BC834DRAFT_970435 [Gloeopeniophorella convolvens]|nr:hypothetical protein BC834DRAFT_970435 [Gloeopeniophorella convolvens]